MKKISLILIILLSFSPVLGTLDMNIQVTTDEDVNSHTNITSQGDVKVWIDGVDIKDKVYGMESYVYSNTEKWSTDTGAEIEVIIDIIDKSMKWLNGENTRPDRFEQELGSSLESHFASDADINYLLNKINFLEIRVEALENSMDKIAQESYCQGKLEVVSKYNLTGVKCGNTTYLNNMKSASTGENILIGLTSADENVVTPTKSPIISFKTQNVNTTQEEKKITFEGFNEVEKPKNTIFNDDVVYCGILSNLVTFNLVLISCGIIYKKFIKKRLFKK